MKWLRTIVIFDQGEVAASPAWGRIHDDIVGAIQAIDFPSGSGLLKLRRKEKLPSGQWNRNGVGYLRRRFLESMVDHHRWQPEQRIERLAGNDPPTLTLYPSGQGHQEPITSDFGDFDLVTRIPDESLVAIEWETGNISSSHRSMNKLAIALSEGRLQAGILILPSRSLYAQLTDRIGNIGELSGYLAMWKALGWACGARPSGDLDRRTRRRH